MFDIHKSNQIVGVDIGQSAVKLVQLAHHKNSFTVEKMALEPLPPGLFKDGQILDVEQVGVLIAHALSQHKFNAKHATACVHYSEVISKRLMVRADLRDHELAQWIDFEVDKFVPFSVANLNIDYHFVNCETDQFEREVQVVACRKETVNKIVSCLELAGLEPLAVDVMHHAMMRASQLMTKDAMSAEFQGVTAVFDMGTSSTRLYVFDGDSLLFQRDELFGAGILVEDIATEYSMADEKVNQAIYRRKLPSSYKLKVLKPYIKLLLKEIERAIRAFSAAGHQEPIARVLLAGGTACVGGLEDIIHKRIHLKVNTLDTVSLLRIDRKLDRAKLKSLAPQLAMACGSAMWTAA